MPEQALKEDIPNILRLLSADEELTKRDLSDHLGVSLGKTNYRLKAIAKKSFVKINFFISKGQKLNKVKYILTQKGIEQKAYLTYYYLKIKEKEYIELKKEAEKVAKNYS